MKMTLPDHQYTAEFKKAVQLIQRTGRRSAQVACDVGVPLIMTSAGEGNE